MISRDYTQEIGVPSQKKTVPRAAAFAILAVIAAAIVFGVVTMLRQTKIHHAAERPAATAAEAPAPSPAKT